mmetsp:Transcript_41942/g.111716  ORF Transcript_41942/g.111716 Transcript_41942/m.111716 type:complete len:200 (+) Transcript_41942:417-1016(+)
MCEHTGTPYEYISDKAEMAKVCSAWCDSPAGDNFAPPVVVDGDMMVSQSISASLYLGAKLGLTPAGYNDYKAMQFCGDIVDTFEGGVGKNNEDGAALKKFIEGDRFARLMGNVERGIVGPYYFGEEPSSVDFFLFSHLDWRTSNVFGPLKEKKDVDVMASYPKMLAIYTSLCATPGYQNYAGGLSKPGPISDEILAAYA